MNPVLEQRIANLMQSPVPVNMALGGSIESVPPEIMVAAEMPMAEEADPALAGIIDEMMMTMGADSAEPSEVDVMQDLEMRRESSDDPLEREMYDKMQESAEAPMRDQAQLLAAEGRGDDTMLAHLQPGEVVLPVEMLEDPQFENELERRFEDLDLDPERYVAGLGIASLNPITGLEEFGFFKKIGKALKKVIRPIAQVAQFIPGPWQPIAAMVNKGLTAYDVAKGRKSPLALANVFGGPGGSLSQNIKGITSLGRQSGGGFLEGLMESARGTGGGIANLIRNPIDSIQRAMLTANLTGQHPAITGSGNVGAMRLPHEGGGMSDLNPFDQSQGWPKSYRQISNLLQSGQDGHPLFRQAYGHPGTTWGGSGPGGAQGASQGWLSRLGFGEAKTPGWIKAIEDIVKGTGRTVTGGISGLLGGGDGERGGLGRLLLGGGVAGLLGKLAYDEAKNRRGVPLTPLTQMNALGRYNIEDEIARRMGKDSPDPVEFGLLPSGTIPELSGGQEVEEKRHGGLISRYRGGGMVPMHYAEGGDVARADFERMNGDIDGEGSEVSDDVPAMLSDGEFVMTGQAVRGAGSFDLSKEGGIITLTPSGEEDREKGTALMYEMMSLFSEFADEPKEVAA
jgi:hypothetical protein